MLDIEAISVSIGYGDFLAAVAPCNRHLFKRWLVVTEPADTETREVCRRYNLDTLLTEDHSRDGVFSKGRLVERGLQHLSAGSWRLHLDADIALPANLHHLLRAVHLNENCIYGWDRLMCRSYAQWQVLKASGYLQGQLDYHCRIHYPPGLEFGTRWAHPQEGYVPIGWCQLWHSNADEWRGVRVRSYPRDHGAACRTDVQFGLQWDRRQRVFLPEIIAIHLESESAPKGANWKGRTTKRFGPPPSPAGESYASVITSERKVPQ